MAVAERVGPPADSARLARLIGQDDLSTLVVALIGLHLDKGYTNLLDAA